MLLKTARHVWSWSPTSTVAAAAWTVIITCHCLMYLICMKLHRHVQGHCLQSHSRIPAVARFHFPDRSDTCVCVNGYFTYAAQRLHVGFFFSSLTCNICKSMKWKNASSFSKSEISVELLTAHKIPPSWLQRNCVIFLAWIITAFKESSLDICNYRLLAPQWTQATWF